MNTELQEASFFPTRIFYHDMDESICDAINLIVEKESSKWQKDYINVKALTSALNYRQHPLVNKIGQFIASTILPDIGKICNWRPLKFRLYESWINFYQKGDKADLHVHSPCDYSAVLITKSSENSLIFKDTKQVHGYLAKQEYENIERINEKKGRLILFPSSIFHGVDEVKSDRITVAFNFETILE